MWSVRRARDRSTDAVVRRDRTRERAASRAEAAKGRPEAANVIVVGPPGCCGCVGQSVGSKPRRKR